MTTDDSGSRVTPFFFRQPGVNAVFDIDIVEIGEGPTGLPQSVTADLRRADADRDVARSAQSECIPDPESGTAALRVRLRMLPPRSPQTKKRPDRDES